MVEDDRFVRRWSRRKEEARRRGSAKPALPEEEGAVSEESENSEDTSELAESPTESVSDDLPDVESLDETSDYKAFMRDGVPEEVRKRALRKLWRSNPIFSVIDGLDEYDEDFTDAALAVKGPLKSAYEIGRGYRKEPVEEVAETADSEVEAAAESGAEVAHEDDAQSADDMAEVEADAEPEEVAAEDETEVKES